MKKLIMSVALVAGLLVSSTAAFAHGGGHFGGVHVGGGVHYSGGVHVGGVYRGGSYRGYYGPYNYYHGPRVGIGVYVGPGYGYGYGWGNSYGYPYSGYSNSISVLVTDYDAYGEPYTHYVNAYWNPSLGGYWYYDAAGNYRRAR